MKHKPYSEMENKVTSALCNAYEVYNELKSRGNYVAADKIFIAVRHLGMAQNYLQGFTDSKKEEQEKVTKTLYNIRLYNKETDKPVWTTHNAIYKNNRWYIDDASIAVSVAESSVDIIVKYYDSYFCMYPLDTDKYEILSDDTTVSHVSKIGQVDIMKTGKEE